MLFSGILLDSYFSGTNKITDIMKKNELKISETVVVDDRAWGILLKSEKCSSFFRKKSKISEIFTDLIAKELKSKVSGRFESFYSHHLVSLHS